MTSLPDLMRRLDRKLDAQRSIKLSYDDLALLVASGAYATLQSASRESLESQCREHIAQSRSTNGETSASTHAQDGTSRSSGMIETEDGNAALARARRTLKVVAPLSTGSTSKRQAANIPRRSAGSAR